jgi:hypothetical protein
MLAARGWKTAGSVCVLMMAPADKQAYLFDSRRCRGFHIANPD